MTTQQRATPPANPFPGLRPFEMEEYRLFFGREGQSDALVARLERSRFLAVVGTSGSGKSSLVRAGLLPGLLGGMMAGAGAGWRVAVLRPGHDPVGNLARALAAEGVPAVGGEGLRRAEAEAVVEATLRRGSLGLVEAAALARVSEREKLLVVVDQFEELFRYRAARAAAGATDDDAAGFVKLLLEAARQRAVPVYVVLTMRSDFLGDCSQFHGLPEAINDGQYLIPRMTRDERRFAITGPVRVARARMTEPLVNRLLNDVGDNPDQLPILQHALMRTWNHWAQHRRDSEPVGLEHYEAVGTMANALSLHADEAWGELPDERSRRVAEVLFKALTERGADNREIRRPTRMREICEIAEATPEEVAAVVEVFRREGRSFLMPPPGVPLTAETVIDISHESLIRNWERLKVWVADEAQSARTYRRLAEAAVLHGEGGEALLQDPALQIALEWFEGSKPNAAWGRRYHPEFDAALAYLEESRAARDAAAEERERQRQAEIERERREREQAEAFADQQRRAARRMRWLAAGMAVMFLLALGGAAYAYQMGARARESEKTARQAQADAERSARETREFADRLAAEKERSDEIAASLKTAKEKTDEALKSEQAALTEQKRALDAQKQATAAANKAADDARRAEQAAKDARQVAEDEQKAAKLSAERLEASRMGNMMHLAGVASVRRGDYEQALIILDMANSQLAKEEEMKKALPPSREPPTEGDKIATALTTYIRSTLAADTGAAHRKLGQHEKAVELYESAWSQIQEALRNMGPDNKLNTGDLWMLFDLRQQLGHAYRDLAAAYAKKITRSAAVNEANEKKAEESYRKAEENYKDAVNYQERLLGLNEDEARLAAGAGGFESLARFYRDLGRFNEAEPYYKRVLELRKKADKAPDTIEALKEAAQFYVSQNKYKEAEPLYEQAIALQRQSAGGDLPLAELYGEMGGVYAGQQDAARAAQAFRLTSLHQGLVRKSGKEALEALLEIGDAYEKLGKFKWAAETYDRALLVPDTGAPDSVRLQMKRAATYKQLKEPARAEEIYQQVLAATATRSGTTEPEARALRQLGALYAETGKASEAEGMLVRALKYWEAQNNHKEAYGVLSDLAAFYRRQGDNDQLLATSRGKLAAAGRLLDGASPNTPTQKAWDAGDYTEAFRLYTQAVSDLSEAFLAKGDKKAAEEVFVALLDERLDVAKVADANVVAAYTQALESRRDVLARAVRPPSAKRNVAAQIKEGQSHKEFLERIGRFFSQGVPQNQK